MSLNERLAALTAQFKSAMSADESAVVEQAAELLRRSGIADRAVKVGQAAPDFTLKDEGGSSVSLTQTREKGPVIVTFYRGVWCPYCNEDLKQAAIDCLKLKGEACREYALKYSWKAAAQQFADYMVPAQRRKESETRDLASAA